MSVVPRYLLDPTRSALSLLMCAAVLLGIPMQRERHFDTNWRIPNSDARAKRGCQILMTIIWRCRWRSAPT